MKVTSIYTNRSYETWPSWHIVHEWEDVLALQLNLKFKNSQLENLVFNSKIAKKVLSNQTINSFAKAINWLFSPKNKTLVFELRNNSTLNYSNGSNEIPIIIDFWKGTDLTSFYKAYANSKLVLVSSAEVFQYLKKNNCPLNIKHVALSISDIYKLDKSTQFTKKYDIILAGRKSPLLWNFMQQFSAKYPDVEYLYPESIDGKLSYISNKNGVLGSFHTREEYISLLQSCRIGFYSTPGMDGGEKRTGGFNPVTPRFLEYLTAKCFMLGRYPENEETRFYDVPKVCPHIETYEQFESTLLNYLSATDVPVDLYMDILSKHYTSVRACEIREIIN
jgi:hypothetical protein